MTNERLQAIMSWRLSAVALLGCFIISVMVLSSDAWRTFYPHTWRPTTAATITTTATFTRATFSTVAAVAPSTLHAATTSSSSTFDAVTEDEGGIGRGDFFNQSSTPPPSRRDRKLAALLTYLRDEDTHLRVWLAHYRQHFDPEDMFILDNESEEPVASVLDRGMGRDAPLYKGAHVRVFACPKRKYFDHRCLIDRVEQAMSELLRYYRFVVFTEVDELLAATGGIRHALCEHYLQPVSRPTSLELLQSEGEAPLDFHRPILGQRKMGRYNYLYDKPAIVGRVLPLTTGFHTYRGAPDGMVAPSPEIRPGLYLIHLKLADKAFCLARLQRQQQQAFNLEEVERGKGIGAFFKAHGNDTLALDRLCSGRDRPSMPFQNVSRGMREAFSFTSFNLSTGGGSVRVKRGFCEKGAR